MNNQIEDMKIAKLEDILRRLIANPQNVKEVAIQLSKDWAPLFKINSDGSYSILIDGKFVL